MVLKIASLAPTNTEILYALGLGDNVIAVTRFCDYPQEVRNKPRVGGWLDLDMNVIRRIEPDVAVTSMFLQDKIVQQFEKMHIPVIHLDPLTLDEVYESILTLGKSFDKEYKARNIVSAMRSRIERIRSLTRNKPKKRVYVEEWHSPPMVSGNWVPDLLEAANAVGLIKHGERSRKIDLHEVREFDPEFIIAAWCGAGENPNKEEIGRRDSWALTKAVMRDNIYMFNDSFLNKPTPRLAEGCERLARVLHPDVF